MPTLESYVEETAHRRPGESLRVRVRFETGRLLEINEALAVEDERLRHLDYRYHCQDAGGGLVFRLRQRAHFPDLPLFPEHKHLPDRTVGEGRPSIERVLAEAGSDPRHQCNRRCGRFRGCQATDDDPWKARRRGSVRHLRHPPGEKGGTGKPGSGALTARSRARETYATCCILLAKSFPEVGGGRGLPSARYNESRVPPG